ncbi:protein ORF15 [Lake sturgeon herpesvirus]|nr:protein ORF15 [Lake sturgeon herpesvirus]
MALDNVYDVLYYVTQRAFQNTNKMRFFNDHASKHHASPFVEGAIDALPKLEINTGSVFPEVNRPTNGLPIVISLQDTVNSGWYAGPEGDVLRVINLSPAKQKLNAISVINHPLFVRARLSGHKYINALRYGAVFCFPRGNISAIESLVSVKPYLPKPANLAKAMAQVLMGLQHVHNCGFIYGSIDPASITMSHLNVVQLSIFSNTHSRTFNYTYKHRIIEYVSPEEASKKPCDQSCDIWAFGCYLFHNIYFLHAFDGTTVDVVLEAIKVFRKTYKSNFYNYCKAKFGNQFNLVPEYLKVFQEIFEPLTPTERPTVEQLLHLPVFKSFIDLNPYCKPPVCLSNNISFKTANGSLVKAHGVVKVTNTPYFGEMGPLSSNQWAWFFKMPAPVCRLPKRQEHKNQVVLAPQNTVVKKQWVYSNVTINPASSLEGIVSFYPPDCLDGYQTVVVKNTNQQESRTSLYLQNKPFCVFETSNHFIYNNSVSVCVRGQWLNQVPDNYDPLESLRHTMRLPQINYSVVTYCGFVENQTRKTGMFVIMEPVKRYLTINTLVKHPDLLPKVKKTALACIFHANKHGLYLRGMIVECFCLTPNNQVKLNIESLVNAVQSKSTDYKVYENAPKDPNNDRVGLRDMLTALGDTEAESVLTDVVFDVPCYTPQEPVNLKPAHYAFTVTKKKRYPARVVLRSHAINDISQMSSNHA